MWILTYFGVLVLQSQADAYFHLSVLPKELGYAIWYSHQPGTWLEARFLLVFCQQSGTFEIIQLPTSSRMGSLTSSLWQSDPSEHPWQWSWLRSIFALVVYPALEFASVRKLFAQKSSWVLLELILHGGWTYDVGSNFSYLCWLHSQIFTGLGST